jgi:hypothetical protein
MSDEQGIPACPISSELRKIGEVCIDLGKKIEASQVEDGDPPFAVNHDEFLLLQHCHIELGKIMESVADAG